MRVKLSSVAASVLAIAVSAVPAAAACKKMGFVVNDYGKDGPTKDAKDLLDKDIAKWAADNGIAKYTVGKKDVKCELFLDVLLFDEHTCTASANVCWNEGPGAASPDKVTKEGAAAPAAKAAETPAAAAKEKAAAKAPEKSAPAPVETGAIEGAKKPAAAAKQEAPPAAAKGGDSDAAERAAAAAERAAAAAERAAAAAEKAAGGAQAVKAETTEAAEVPAEAGDLSRQIAPVGGDAPKD